MNEIRIKDVAEHVKKMSQDDTIVGFCLTKGSHGEFFSSTEFKFKKIKKIKDELGEKFIVAQDDDLEYDFYAMVLT